MIVGHEKKFCFVSVPRTKSSSTRKWLVEHHGGKQVNELHDARVLDDTQGYFYFAGIRDPIARAWSTWRHERRTDHFWYSSFVEFCRRYGEVVRDDPKLWVMLAPQAAYLSPVYHRLDRIFRWEEIPHAYVELPFVESVDEIRLFPHRGVLHDGLANQMPKPPKDVVESLHYWLKLDFTLWELSRRRRSSAWASERTKRPGR